MRNDSSSPGLKALIIHLARAENRRAQVANLRASLPCPSEIVWAVDARAPAAEGQEGNGGTHVHSHLTPRYPYALRDTEVACFRSHRKSWQRIVDEGLEAALVLEDDVALERAVFDRALALAMSVVRPGDFIRFPYKRREDAGRVVAQEGEMVLRLPEEVALGMQVQLVTRGAAERLLRTTEVFDRPVDCLLQMPWVHGARVLTVWPSGVSEESGDLGGSTIGHKALGWDKIRREILRPLYRRRISRLSQDYFASQP